ncbi:MAG: tRNA (cytidine(34)-2'-O)-methyltransferase [Eubacteriaceae bacterium]|nr:tRNA (cytidine(34)-2'-O)-methyltransferase [Eubacteriaceae bacterium]
MPNFNVVLFEPQIPQNTGNIARTCALTGSRLHLIKPYGFTITERNLRRAGLDYWKDVDIFEHNSFEDFMSGEKPARIIAFTSKASDWHTSVEYFNGEYLLFGNETTGLPPSIHLMPLVVRVRIPMAASPNARCLNLSNSVGIGVYEALRQTQFAGMV